MNEYCKYCKHWFLQGGCRDGICLNSMSPEHGIFTEAGDGCGAWEDIMQPKKKEERK